MNPALRRTGVIALILLGALLVQVTWVQFIHHDRYDEFDDARTLFAEYEVPRGSILAGDTVIAQSLPSEDDDSAYAYYRDYPEGDYFGNITGFKSPHRGSSAMEAAQNEVLNGSSSLFFLDELGSSITGEDRVGGNVVLTIDPELQKAAYDAIAETGVPEGGAVVLDPRTGQILAEASYPGWNPTEVSSNNYETSTEAWEAVINAPGNPGSDRTRSDWYPPGSTFKTIVASAFLEQGHDADTMVPAGNSYTAPDTDHTITNAGDQCPAEEMTLREAYALSCNTTFARLCVEELSEEDILDTAAAYGFEEAFTTPLETIASTTGDISEEAFRAQACIGQQEVRETIVQNAMIAAAIANGGEVMAPQMIAEITDSEGTTLKRGEEDSLGEAVSSSTAEEMRKLMEAVVQEGTGESAQIDGITVGGKTGTAEHSAGAHGDEANHGWFHGWAMNEDGEPAVAVAVYLGAYGPDGSHKAAEIAGDLMEQVLSGD
ncbi:penicillin-binding transpeptidase domain-containing protein [Glycomyces arizonensis]|uniref:penicillin-binding transpeptidase domain-containing protein n=1 Tax=Glycomyces arizonensis TaxID=256035 RepID=UPI00041596C8|nr:penicillin-binding transpeptidase domain-containing protein [Glycomyces arizonensis]